MSSEDASKLSLRARWLVLGASSLGLLFDGIELGLMPVASLSVSQSLIGQDYTKPLGQEWFAWFTASLMLGAAIGGIVLGRLGDRIGRSKAMGVSILFYSIFALLGAWVENQNQMLCLRFLVGLGVGGMWPNGMALVAECWPKASRAWVAGIMSAGLNAGILVISQVTRMYPITADSWRWLFMLAGLPGLLGIFVLALLPESPSWLLSRQSKASSAVDLETNDREGALEFSGRLWRVTLLAMLLSSIPLVSAWSASKWMIPWADSVAGASDAGYKSVTQGWWALGATLGSFFGAQIATWLGPRLSYFGISIGSVALTLYMFNATGPLQPWFHPTVFVQGFVTTLFFGWLAVYLPALFPTSARASGCGLAYNFGRFATAIGVFGAGSLLPFFGNSYPRIGSACAMLYGLGVVAAWLIPKKLT
ncbi:MAG: MFS transporter [Planctomycetota bacterium]|jgi:MFS family permease